MLSAVHSLLLLAATLSSVVNAHNDHSHHMNKALPGRWYQDEDSHAHKLFKRAGTDGITYPEVGSQEWYNAYPQRETIDNTPMPKAWTDALDAAIKAGKICGIAPSKALPDQNPTYDGKDPTSPEICSATYKCRIDGDLWDAPDGVFGSSFDDGPLPTSNALYDFLAKQNVVTTHFFIGLNILNNAKEFLRAFSELKSDIAVHTYTHRYMTTLTNEQFLGEIGWTMELIHNSTGGRLPKYWRPPYGDSDCRTSAIAKEVFGLTTSIWNQDTDDWSVGEKGGSTRAEVDANLKKWLTGPKSPGLIILEHELSNDTVGAFIEAYPLIASNGWKFESLARMDGGDVYQNSPDSTGDVTPGTVAVEVASPPSNPSDTSSSSSSTPTGSPPQAPNNGANNTQTSTSQAANTTGAAGNGNGAPSHYGSSGALVTFAGLVVAAFAFS